MKTFVFYTNDDYVNNRVTGGTRRFIELVTGLMERGNQVHLFLPDHADFPSHPNLVRHSIKRKRRRLLPAGLVNFVYNYRQLKRIAKMPNARVVMVSVPYGIQGVLAGIRGFALIVWEDFVDYRRIRLKTRGMPPFLMGIFEEGWRLIEWLTVKRAGRIIVQCRHDQQVLMHRHPGMAEKLDHKTVIIHNDVNPVWISNMGHLKNGKSSLVDGRYHIGFIGNMDDLRKGLHLLLASVARLLDEEKPLRLHVIGDGRLRKDYMKKYRAYEQIVFYGSIEYPMKALSTFDLLVVPSLSDSFPNTIMEALYLGVPVLGARRGGIPEMLYYDELLFEPDTRSLYRKLSALIDKRKNERMEHLRKLCHERQKAFDFDWIEVMQKGLSG